MLAVLAVLETRYANLAAELVLITGSHPLNQPEVKTQDGGTTILKSAKIKQLEDSLKETAEAIKRHMDLIDEIDGTNTFSFETQLEL